MNSLAFREPSRRISPLLSIAVHFSQAGEQSAADAGPLRSRKVMKINLSSATLAMTGSGEIERPVEKLRPTSWLVQRMRR